MTDLVPAPVPAPGTAWPSTPGAFVDTTLCPRCFAHLPSSRCGSCGLELDVPLASELIAASNLLVETEGRRRGLIDRMWSEQLAWQRQAIADRAIADRATPVPPPQVPTHAPDAAVAAAALVFTPPAPPPHSEAAFASAAAVPRRSGVQVFLLVTGIVLLSVFALFFLTVAYLFASVEVRVAVTALAGLVAFGVAWMLARRRLPATAEGVGSTGAAILLAVLGFVRGAELFGSASIAPALFSGVGLLILAAVLLVLHRLTAMRFARLGTILLAPTGLALVVVGALHPVDPGVAWWAGLVAAGASTLLMRPADGRGVEATLLRSMAFVSTTAALVPAALLLPEVSGMSALAYGVCAVIWGGYVLRFRRESAHPAWSGAASVLLGLSAALAPAIAILRAATTEVNLWAPGAAAGLVAAVFIVLTRRSAHPITRLVTSRAQVSSLALATVGLLPGIGLALVSIVASLVPRSGLWQANPGDDLGSPFTTTAWAAVLAPTIAAVLGAAAIRLANLPLVIRAVVGSLAGLALLSTASQGSRLLPVILGYLLVSASGLAVLLVVRRRHASALRVPAALVFGVATLALIVLSHASSVLWPSAVLASAGLIVAARWSVAFDSSDRRTVRALLTALAVALLFAESGLVAPWMSALQSGTSIGYLDDATPMEFAVIPGAAAALLLCVAPLLPRARRGRVARGLADLHATTIVALPVAAISSVIVFAAQATSIVDQAARIAIPLAVAAAGTLWQIRVSTAHLVSRVILATLAPLTIATALSASADAIASSSGVAVGSWAGPAAAILSATIGVTVFRRATPGLRGAARLAWECATAVVIVVTIIDATTTGGDDTGMILLLLAVPPLIVGFADGNPFLGTTPRRYIPSLSVILAVAALWQFLAIHRVDQVEAYTLPVAGLFFCITAAIAVFGNRSSQPVFARSAVFVVGLVIALGPSAAVTTTESSVRAVTLLAAAAALTVAALLAPRVIYGILVRNSALMSALAVLAVVGIARAGRDAAISGDTALVPELWVIPAAVGLVATSIVWTRRRALPFRVAQLGVPAAIVLVSLSTLVCLVARPDSPVRLAIASLSLAVVVVGASGRRRVPLDRVSQYTALSFLIVVGVTGLITSSAHPFELATAPLALALTASGIIVMRRDPTARSWPNLGPALAVLLVPPLLADFGSTDLWRIIALGVLAVAIVVAAVALRWQAPLVMGTVVLLVHAVAQSWPWIQDLYSAVPWWIWLGVGGVVLVAVAARYEHRVRNLRSFAGSISALR